MVLNTLPFSEARGGKIQKEVISEYGKYGKISKNNNNNNNNKKSNELFIYCNTCRVSLHWYSLLEYLYV